MAGPLGSRPPSEGAVFSAINILIRNENGAIVLGSGGGFRLVETLYAPYSHLACHKHDIADISLVLSGSLVEESDCGMVTAGPGCVVFKPAGAMHSNRVGPRGAVLFALRLDPSWSIVATQLRKHLWCSQEHVTGVMLRLYALCLGRHRLDRDVDELAIRAGLAAACDGVAPFAFGRAPDWLSTVQERVHVGDNHSTKIAELARECETHPVYLARMFRRCLGAAPGEYVRRLRVTLAAHRLVSTADSLSRIAAEVGFSDQAHFCRCFRSQVGHTPGQYRRLASSA